VTRLSDRVILADAAILKLQDIAERLQCRLEGDGSLEIRRLERIEHARPGDLTFLANPKYRARLQTTQASAVIVGRDAALDGAGPALLRSDDPYLAFARAVELFVRPAPPASGVDPTSAVAPGAVIGADASIGPFVAIGAGASIGQRTVVYPHVAIGAGARIGDDCVIHAQVSIRERVQIGNRVVVQDGAVIGSDGFGFVKQADGTHRKIPQHADVVIEDDVEIGANTTIDRPAVGETRIMAGTKIDNLVQVAHGVTVGRRVLFAAQVGIAGSTVIEDDVVLAGQVGVAGHIRVGAGAVATGQTGLTSSIEAGAFVSGCPEMPNREWLKSSAVFKDLPALKKRVALREQRLAALADNRGGEPDE
jgi:UDP-3-O-[3-hydroxymyristoyl] glucosamine N-acyltransferase